MGRLTNPRIVQKIRKKRNIRGEIQKNKNKKHGEEKNGIIESVENSTNILCS